MAENRQKIKRMFRDMDYAVLYEGVEDDGDETRCREMSATYLQGSSIPALCPSIS